MWVKPSRCSDLGVVAIIQARIGSTRLRGKVLESIMGEPMLAHVVARSCAIRGVDEVVVATTIRPEDEAIVDLCRDRRWPVFRGSEHDVLDRYFRAGVSVGAEHVVRITSDCPLVCPLEGARVVQRHRETGADYTHNITVWGSGMPLGTGVEVFTMQSLETSWQDGLEPHHREHVDEYVGEHPERFRIERVVAPPRLRRPELRLTVDTPEDLALVREIYRSLYRAGRVIPLDEVIALVDQNPELLELNRHVVQKPI